ncbi:MAG: Holliday junction branch migration protein RuvA [Actinomycetota bacterium]
MIGSLRGIVRDRDPGLERSAASEVLLEVQGVGYRVFITADTLDRIRLDEEAVLFIHHHIRESEQRLFGFWAKEDRVAFESLLKANGVGPALALAILSTYPATRLAHILADDDLTALCEVPGVGKKTAQRLLVELRSTLVLPVPDTPAELIAGADTAGAEARVHTAIDDVRDALVSLGYGNDEVRAGVAAASAAVTEDPSLDSGRLLKTAIRSLAGG